MQIASTTTLLLIWQVGSSVQSSYCTDFSHHIFHIIGSMVVQWHCHNTKVSLFSGSLPQSKDVHVGLIGDYKLVVGVDASMNSCLSVCLCGRLVVYTLPLAL